MALTKIAFAFKAEPSLDITISLLKDIESVIIASLSGREYGLGVKEIYIGIVLMDPRHAERFMSRKVVYKAGKYINQQFGFPLTFEDTLEFDLLPTLEEVRHATRVEDLAVTLRRALVSRYSILKKFSNAKFDVERFLADLETVLNDISMIGASKVLIRLVESVDSRKGGMSGEMVVNPASIRAFARDVVEFVERELPNVLSAVEARRVDLLKPVLARSHEMLDRWRAKSQGVLDACPACACLIADVVREGAIELDEIDVEVRMRFVGV